MCFFQKYLSETLEDDSEFNIFNFLIIQQNNVLNFAEFFEISFDINLFNNANEIIQSFIYDKFKFPLNKLGNAYNETQKIKIKEMFFNKKIINYKNTNNIESNGFYQTENSQDKIRNLSNLYILDDSNICEKKLFNESYKAEYKKNFRILIKINLNAIKQLPIMKNHSENEKEFMNEHIKFFNKETFYYELIDSFVIFARKLFIIYNHINFKIFSSSSNCLVTIQDRNLNYDKTIIFHNANMEYNVIYEEKQSNLIKYHLKDFKSFLPKLWLIDKENFFISEVKEISIIIAFEEYKPYYLEEKNKLEINFTNNWNSFFISEEFNFLSNLLIINNKNLKKIFNCFGIEIEDPSEYFSKINENNPFIDKIREYFIKSNFEKKQFWNIKGMKYVSLNKS